MVEFLGIFSTILAVIGVCLNNRHRIECFKVWILSNLLSLIIHVATATWSLAGRDAIFVILAIQGMRMWKRAGLTTRWEVFQNMN